MPIIISYLKKIVLKLAFIPVLFTIDRRFTNMATDSERFDKALGKWDSLQRDECFSVPPQDGTLAVVLAYDHKRDKNPKTIDSYVDFEVEALKIAGNARLSGKSVELVLNATRSDFRSIIQDEKISDVTVIGNGCLSSVAVPDEKQRVDWLHISRMSTHLKTGSFTQRFCGQQSRQLNVPLGLFAVDDHRKVNAPVGRFIRPTGLKHRHNRHIQPITQSSRLSLDDIKEQFPYALYSTWQRAGIYANIMTHLVRKSLAS
jgi:hypothetical protein